MIFRCSCPACKKTLFFPEKHGLAAAKQEIVCQNCDRRYQIQYWQVLEGTTRQQSKLVKKIGRTETIDLTCYQLKVTNSEQRKKDLLEFTIPERENFQIFSGNDILTISVRNNANILGIINLDSGQKYLFYSLIKSTIKHGFICGAIAFVVCSIVAIFLGIPKQILQSLLLSISPTVGILAGYFHWQESKETDLIKLRRLREEQNYLEKMSQCHTRLEELAEERHRETRLLDRLRSIKQEMIDLDRDTYNAQINIYNKGISALEGQSKLTQNLIDKYQKTLSMFRIGYNTSQIESSLPDLSLSNANISARLNELDALERKRQEMVEEVKLTTIL